MPTQTKFTGKVTLATSNPSIGGQAEFRVDSSDPDLFVHLKGYKDGTLVYEGWNRWFHTNIVFTLASPALTSGPAQFKALLEDWSQYAQHGKTTLVDELDFTAS